MQERDALGLRRRHDGGPLEVARGPRQEQLLRGSQLLNPGGRFLSLVIVERGQPGVEEGTNPAPDGRHH